MAQPEKKIWTRDAWLEATSATATLLDALRLEGYLFEVEPRDERDELEIRVEWVSGGPAGTWTTTRLTVDAESLLLSRTDPVIAARILRDWRPHFRAKTGRSAKRGGSRARHAGP